MNGIDKEFFKIESRLQQRFGRIPSEISSTLINTEHEPASKLTALDVKWGSDSKLPRALLLKEPVEFWVVGSTRKYRNVVERHNQECVFFDSVKKLGTDWSEMDMLNIPYCYEYQLGERFKDPFLLLKNSLKGSRVPTIEAGLRLEQIVPVINNITVFHAASILYPDWLKQFPTHGQKNGSSQLDQCLSSMTYLHRNYPELYPYSCDSLQESLHSAHALCQISEDGLLNHGNMWSENLAYSRNDDRNEQTDDETSSDLVAIMNWGDVVVGNCAEDIARLMATSCSARVRRDYTVLILRKYFAQLEKVLKKYDQPVPFSVGHVVRSFQTAFAYYGFLVANDVYAALTGSVAEEERSVKELLVTRAACATQDAISYLRKSHMAAPGRNSYRRQSSECSLDGSFSPSFPPGY